MSPHLLFSFSSDLAERLRDKLVINIFVRNLDLTTTETQLKEIFAAYGRVETVTIVKDRDTEGPRGFAFLEMINDAEAQAAIESLNGVRLNGSAIRMNEARPKEAHDSARDSSREHRRHRI
jgi:RNA recognition motif-containing protein